MTVDAGKLVRMAEQIAANITVSDDPDIIAGELAAHLQRFWDPRMLSEFLGNAENSEFEASPAVTKAVTLLACQ